MTPNLVFIDEFGNSDLDVSKSGVSDVFVLCAVVVGRADEEAYRGRIEKVRRRHFQSGPMKSKGVGKNDLRRVKVLRDLVQADTKFMAFVVNKSELRRDSGYEWKRSFIKNLNGFLYRRIFEAYPSVRVTADEHGSPEFMREFRAYVRSRFGLNMFTDQYLTHATDENEPLLQPADFIAGCIGKLLQGELANPYMLEIRELIRAGALGIHEWPPISGDQAIGLQPDSSRADREVLEYALRQAEVFIRAHSMEEGERRLQVEALEYLLFKLRYVDAAQYVSTGELIQQLEDSGNGPLTERHIRSAVVGPLRDSGLLIASSSGGYKLPATVADMRDFVESFQRTIEPMVARLGKAREQVRIVSGGTVDLLEGPGFAALRNIVESNDLLSEVRPRK